MTDFLDQLVTPAARKALLEERDLLVELREALEADESDERRRVGELLEGLDELFTIVVVGEFNSGKSTFINALFGQPLRKEGPVPVDDCVSILRYGEEETQRRLSDFVVEQTYPVEVLRAIRLVDTPGTNSIVRQHQEITEDFIPRADLILFATSIDRPLSESEKEFLDYIGEWRKKVVFVLNKIDTKSDEEVDEVMKYLDGNLRSIYGGEPRIFPVAAKLALGAKQGALSPREWTRSRFEALEDYILRTLSDAERVRLKLQAPLETVLSIVDRKRSVLGARERVLGADMEKIESIRVKLSGAESDLTENFSRFITRIDNMILGLERRGVDFLDRYIRIQHIMLLRKADRFRGEFERQVFHEWEGSVDRTIQESVDWLVDQNMKLWRSTVDEFRRHTTLESAPSGLATETGTEFAYNREQVYGRIRSEAERRMQDYDVGSESRAVIDSAMRGVFQSLGLGAGAIGLGYLVSTFFTSAAIDVTGLTAATMLLVASFLVLPYKRSRAMTGFRAKVERLRTEMGTTLERQSSAEIGRMVASIGEVFNPYVRFFQNESEKIEKQSAKMKSIRQRSEELLERVSSAELVAE